MSVVEDVQFCFVIRICSLFLFRIFGRVLLHAFGRSWYLHLCLHDLLHLRESALKHYVYPVALRKAKIAYNAILVLPNAIRP